MVSAKVWQAWGDARIDVVEVASKLYFGSDEHERNAKKIKEAIEFADEKGVEKLFETAEMNGYSETLYTRACAYKMLELARENNELRKADSARPVLPIPAAKFVRNTSADSQFKHIIEECGEVAKELRNGNTEFAALELADVVTSCFTLLEILGYDEEARSEFFRQTNKKNEERGYFETEGVAK